MSYQSMLVEHMDSATTALFQEVPAGEIRWSLERGGNRVNNGFTGRELRWTISLNRLAAVTTLFGQSHVVMSDDVIVPKLSVR